MFVGEYKKEGIAKFILVKHTLKLFTGFRDTLTIVGIDDEDDALSVLKIWKKFSLATVRKGLAIAETKGGRRTMSPKRTNLILTSNIPDGETNVFILDSFNVES